MYLSEFAVQGARGFSPSLRLSLRPGYLVLKPVEGSPPPLSGLVSALLFADGRGGEAVFAVPGQKAKAGLSLVGNDQGTYRVTRELGGAGSLFRFDKAKNGFVPVTEDSAEMGQYLRGQVGLPTKSAFEQLFTLSPAHLPSRKPKPKPQGAEARASGSKPMLASNQPVTAAADVGLAKAKLAELRKELAHAQEVDQIQFKLDGMASEVFELEQRLKSTEGLKAALKDAEAAHAAAPTPEALGLPPDIVERAERYPLLTQKRDDALAKLEADRQQAETALPSHVEPLTKNPHFWAGIGVGVLFLGLGLVVGGVGRYLALLDIPAFGFAALTALKYVEELQGAQRLRRKGKVDASREKKIQEEFEAEAKYVRDAMAALKVETHTEIADVLGRKGLLLQKVQDYRDQLAALEGDPEFAEASGRYRELKAQQEALNEELSMKGAFVRDMREVEREIARTEESIQLAAQGPAPTAAAGTPPAPGEALEDPAPGLLKLASDLLQADVPGSVTVLRDRLNQYATALTDKRVLAVELDKDGKATALVAGNKRVPAGELPPRDLDLVYLALRLTIVEKVATRVKVPLLIEDAPGLEEGKLPLFARMLKHLGTLTQVVHTTAHPAFASVAEVSANL